MRATSISRRSVLLTALGFLAASHSASAADLIVEATLPRSGGALVFGFGSLWMMSDGRLTRIDPKDNSIVDIEIPTGDGGLGLSDTDKYRGLAIGENAVWIPDVGNSLIYKVDPQSNAVALTIPTFIVGSAGNIGVGEGSIWVITFDHHDKTLTRYNAANGAKEAEIPLPRPCKGMVVDYGKVWVAAASAAELYVVDPNANQVAKIIPIHAPTHLLASGDGSIWIGYDAEGLVEQIDAAAVGQAVRSISTGVTDMESDGDITVGGGYVWMITRGSTLAQIDARTGSLKDVHRPAVGTLMGRRIRFGAGALWVSGAAIFRIKPPT